jgi:hypothetical protein
MGHMMMCEYLTYLRRNKMTDQEKIDLLSNALTNLMQSADNYIDDGSWIEDLTIDIDTAKAVVKLLYPELWDFGGDES